jgi:hypothetical protein
MARNTTVYFPPELLTWLRHRAIDTGQTLTVLVTEICQAERDRVEALESGKL